MNVNSTDRTLQNRSETHGVLLGKQGNSWVWSGAQRSALILGPTRSGKTTSIVIPNILCATGPVVSTSTKPDVMDSTATARSNSGTCLLFDPTNSLDDRPGVVRVGWSPLRLAATWDGAIAISDSMVRASQLRSQGAGSHDHWAERSSALLSTLLFAAKAGDLDMKTVLSWTDRHQGSAALEILEAIQGPVHPSTSLLDGILATDAREQSGIWSTTSGVLGAYRSLNVLESTTTAALDSRSFLEEANTLYVCAPGSQQTLIAPLVVGLVNEIQAEGYKRNRNERPLLLALDELANIAPLPDLPRLVSEGSGQGVLTIGCLQDLSQARARWGSQAEGFLSLFSTTVVMPGIADITTLRTLRDLAGTTYKILPSESTSRSARGQRTESHSLNLSREPRLEIDILTQGRRGEALLLDASKRMGWIALSPSYRDQPWRSLLSDRKLERSDASRTLEIPAPLVR